MKYDKAELAALFAKPFDDARWADVLAELFGAREDENGRILKPQPFDRPFPDAKGWYLGSFTTADGYLVGLFRFETDSVRRRRVGLRNLLKPMLKWQHDAALAVFTERGSPAWRFSFVCDLKGEATAAKRFTYVFGDPASPFRTPVQRFLALRDAREEGRPVTFAAMQDAFSVEALSDEFFRAYKEHYETFVSRVTGKRFVKEGGKWVETAVGRPDRDLYRTFGNDDKRVRDYVKKMLGRLVFLHFLQKKGWLGARKGGWTGGDPAFLLHLFEKADSDQQDDFLDEVLEPLFFNALNTDRSARGDLFDTGVPGIGKCRIPYLNGGLFEKDDLDELRVKFPAAYFRDLLRFFSEYNFTIDENDADEAEVGIDPEMLGRIFENLLEDNKDKGAFYTPKEIVRYMCRRSLLAHLSDGEDQASADAIAAFFDTRDPGPLPKKTAARLAAKLRDVKICDPAIGSGAFPMGLLRELFALRSALDPDADDLKRQIIENNIYGVDIEKGAVDIARLRFWLALVVDADEPVPLPNLDFKIMQGNSLVESWKGHDLSGLADGAKTKTLPALSLPGIPAPAMQLTFFDAAAKPHRVKLRSLLHQWFTCSDHKERDRLRKEIRAAVEDIFEGLGSDVSLAGIDPSATTEFFLWHLWFAEVFDNGGFDIVIGNPPYIQLQRNEGELAKCYQDVGFKTFDRTGDIYCLFYEQGFERLRNGGHLCFITSNKWMRASYGAKLRKYLADNTNPEIVIDFAGEQIFSTAMVDVNIFLGEKGKPNAGKTLAVLGETGCQDNLAGFVEQKGVRCSFPSEGPWMILAPEEQNIMGKIDKIGTPLREWDVQINYGIKTACNEVYIIDEATRQTLVKKHPKSKKLIFPILKDNTLRAYTIVWDNRYLINFHNGYTSFSGRIVEPCDPEDYPSIKAHIDKVAAELDMGVRRTRGGHKGSNRGFFARSDRGVTPYNLRNCAYIDAFSLPKIVWKQTSSMQTFTLDLEGRFLDVSGCFLWKQGMSDTQLKYLLGILNSRLAHYWFLQNAVAFGAKGIRWVPETVFRYPIPMISAAQEKRLARLVDRVLAAKTRNPEADTTELESEIDTLVYTLYGLTPEEIAILEKSP